MAKRTLTYDPNDITIIVGGTIIEGYADGTFVSVARNTDSYSGLTGASGEYARSRSNDTSGTFTITLLQTSASNAVLSAYHAADELSNAGTFVVTVKDSTGNDIYNGAVCWVQKYADAEYGKEVTEREWVISTSDLLMVVAGK